MRKQKIIEQIDHHFFSRNRFAQQNENKKIIFLWILLLFNYNHHYHFGFWFLDFSFPIFFCSAVLRMTIIFTISFFSAWNSSHRSELFLSWLIPFSFFHGYLSQLTLSVWKIIIIRKSNPNHHHKWNCYAMMIGYLTLTNGEKIIDYHHYHSIIITK